ncbi:hypothetical protein RND71_000845 [Anisodus tanguticus]|uniref:Uncharacterized protein n=1 Tax=Anisodus tanguticus TaxID=243964 RepID=A0AAE1VQE2_9SOLA|nr:hypothetical protein RND71_000845 [Anisodus tanguticus]
MASGGQHSHLRNRKLSLAKNMSWIPLLTILARIISLPTNFDLKKKTVPKTLELLRQAKAADAKDPMAVAADLGFDDNCKKVVDEVVGTYGRIDILVNNAAEQYEASSVEEINEERLERVLELTYSLTLSLGWSYSTEDLHNYTKF